MLDLIVKGTKMAVVVFWIALALSLVSVIPGPYGLFIVWAGGFVLLIHLFEYFFVKFRFAGEISFVKSMLFGFTYWLPIIIDDRENRH